MKYVSGAKVFGCWTVERVIREDRCVTICEIRRMKGRKREKRVMKVVHVPGYLLKDAVRAAYLLTTLKGQTGIAEYEAYQTEKLGDEGYDLRIRMKKYQSFHEYQKEHPIRKGEVWQMALELGEGLETARHRGISHGMIGPEYILADQKGHFLLSDFGMAPFLRETTWTGDAWEDPAKDVYDLGCLLKTLLNEKEEKDQDAFERGITKASSESQKERYPHAGAMLYDLKQIPKRDYQKAWKQTQRGRRRMARRLAAAAAGGAAVLLVGIWTVFQYVLPEAEKKEKVMEISLEAEQLPVYSAEDIRPAAELLDQEETELLAMIEDGIDQFNENALREIRTEDTAKTAMGEESYSLNTILTIDEGKQMVREEESYSDFSADIMFYTVEDGKDYMYDTYYGYDEERKDYRDLDERILLDETAPDGIRYGALTADQRLCNGMLSREDEAGLIDCQVKERSRENGVVHIEIELQYLWLDEYTIDSVLETYGIREEDLQLYDQGREIIERYTKLQEHDRKQGNRVTWHYWIEEEGHGLVQSRRVERMPETEELYECRTELYRMQTYIRSYNNFLEQGSSELEARRGTDEDIKKFDENQEAYEERIYSTRMTKAYLIGEACGEMTGFPADYRDITYLEVQERLKRDLYGDSQWE
ncbi:hypothetical protein [Merdimonas faecis]|uniref:hypothetical protein n=1 Tax=Merdimonas faecis TaxID=1653435 RepID=UPI0023F7A035|nr:hypothetical protein [Merdimonas faecis]